MLDSCVPMDYSPPDHMSMGFPRQGYWSGLPFSSPWDIPDPGIKLVSPAMAGRFCITQSLGSPRIEYQFSSVHFRHSIVSNSLSPHELQHTGLSCPSPTPRAHSNSCPLSQWCYPTISSSVVPFSCCLQSFPASRSFLMSQFFSSGGQSIGVSASASYSALISFRIDWFDLLAVQGLSRVFSNTTVQKHQFFGTQLSLWSTSHIHTWPLEKPYFPTEYSNTQLSIAIPN